MAINRKVGESLIFSGGNEPASPIVEIAEWTPSKLSCQDGGKILHIHGGGFYHVPVSLETLKAIIEWAEKE